jgi:hypothetical protein
MVKEILVSYYTAAGRNVAEAPFRAELPVEKAA